MNKNKSSKTTKNNEGSNIISLKRKSRHIEDYIHGPIELENIYWEIIDSPHFQRLRDLHQNGCSYFVFPSASHTRFEHCIGTAYIANIFMKSLRSRQFELNISDQDIINVTIAGLCHDLGHGPYSHTFENTINNIIEKKFCHEEASYNLLKDLYERKKFKFMTYDDLEFIKCLIKGKGEENYNENKSKIFIYKTRMDVSNNK